MAAEGVRRDSPGVVDDREGGYRPEGVHERMARLEVKMDESRDDRRRIREKLEEVEKNLSDQLKLQTERSAYMDIMKWVAALILTSVGGYFFAQLTTHVDRNTAVIEQHQGILEHPR
jgi:hypothetical protein